MSRAKDILDRLDKDEPKGMKMANKTANKKKSSMSDEEKEKLAKKFANRMKK